MNAVLVIAISVYVGLSGFFLTVQFMQYVTDKYKKLRRRKS